MSRPWTTLSVVGPTLGRLRDVAEREAAKLINGEFAYEVAMTQVEPKDVLIDGSIVTWRGHFEIEVVG